MYDPFLAHHPPVIVEEIDALVFDDAWGRCEQAAGQQVACPVCGLGAVADRGTSPAKHRPWIRFTCGHVIAEEMNAG